MKPSTSVRSRTGWRGKVSTSGIRHGSALFARYESESTITGVMYATAIRNASSITEKHSPGVAGARIGSALSELRP